MEPAPTPESDILPPATDAAIAPENSALPETQQPPEATAQEIPVEQEPLPAATAAQDPTNTLSPAMIDAEISETALLAMGFSYLNRGVRGLEAARDSAQSLRKDYEKAIRKHRNVKLAALAVESLLMAFYGYGAVEHYTGYKGTTAAMVTNSAISGGISVTRASVQYGLMKRGEEAFKAGDKARGMVFTGIGLSLALINSLFVAAGFANKYVMQEQNVATHELDKIAAAEAKIHEAKATEAARINAGIDALDKKLSEVRSGTGDPRIASIESQMNRLGAEIDQIRNHPSFNDGRETEWDRTARTDMNNKSALIDKLAEQKTEILQNPSSGMSAEQRQMLEATTQQRLALNAEIAALDERFRSQFDAQRVSRQLWESKLVGASSSGNDSFSALVHNPTILIEALANVAAISVANWWAATEGHKQEIIQDILTAKPDDPWAEDGQEKAPPASGRTFMGYDYSKNDMFHLRNEARINSLAKMIGNPEAMRAEMRTEIIAQHGKMVELLHASHDRMTENEYKERLGKVNDAFKRALELIEDDSILQEIRLVASTRPQEIKVEDAKIPVFDDPEDPKFKALPSGAQFKTKQDGTLRVKL